MTRETKEIIDNIISDLKKNRNKKLWSNEELLYKHFLNIEERSKLNNIILLLTDIYKVIELDVNTLHWINKYYKEKEY